MPPKTLHIIRHAEGYHQLPYAHPNFNLHDPSLTPLGISQVQTFSASFPHHSTPKLICASPLTRTLQTASIAFTPEIAAGATIIALPDAQEVTAAPSDTGSDAAVLKAKFGETVDLGLVGEGWYVKEGANGTEDRVVKERARRLRRWLRGRGEECLVLVTHGLFAHYVTGHIDENGGQTGEWWTNVMWRTYTFAEDDEEGAGLVETPESIVRGDAEHAKAKLGAQTVLT